MRGKAREGEVEATRRVGAAEILVTAFTPVISCEIGGFSPFRVGSKLEVFQSDQDGSRSRCLRYVGCCCCTHDTNRSVHVLVHVERRTSCPADAHIAFTKAEGI